MDLSFRPGGPDDAPALVRVLVEGFETYREWMPPTWSPKIDLNEREYERLARRLGDDEVWCRVAESAGEAVGYVTLTPAYTREEPRELIPGLAHIWHIFVSPRWWGSGVAPRLMAEATEEAVARGYSHARLWTPRDNTRARAFYEREGWRASGAERYAEDLDIDLVEYRRALPG